MLDTREGKKHGHAAVRSTAVQGAQSVTESPRVIALQPRSTPRDGVTQKGVVASASRGKGRRHRECAEPRASGCQDGWPAGEGHEYFGYERGGLQGTAWDTVHYLW